MVYMDENGDAEGNYTLVALKGQNGLFPVGSFQLNDSNYSSLPVVHIQDEISWSNGEPPRDGPLCGFQVI